MGSERSSRRGSRCRPKSRSGESADSNDSDDTTIPPQAARSLPPVVFTGHLRSVLLDLLWEGKVLIIGGPRADYLQRGMSKDQIQSVRLQRQATEVVDIPTSGRNGSTLVIVDVVDYRHAADSVIWFCKVSDALHPGGLFVTISICTDVLETLAMLCQSCGWGIEKHSEANFQEGILIAEKGATSDAEMLRRSSHFEAILADLKKLKDT